MVNLETMTTPVSTPLCASYLPITWKHLLLPGLSP